MKRLALVLALTFAAGSALAQPGPRKGGPGYQPREHMSQEQRQRLRQDLNDARREVYRERPREERMRRGADAGRLSPEEREQLRRDILDANRQLRR